jgi:hypothetical protein
MPSAKPLSDQLLEAVGRLDTLSKPALEDLLRRAAVEMRGIEMSGSGTLEHIPVYCYHLLRRLSQGPVALRTLYGVDDESAVSFLVSRGLAAVRGETIVSTPAGRAIGEIQDMTL